MTWNFFLNTWIKLLRGWEELEARTLPKVEVSMLTEALSTMQQSTVLCCNTPVWRWATQQSVDCVSP